MPIETPEGTHILEATLEKLDELWNRVKVIPGMFDDFTRGNEMLYKKKILSQTTVWLETDDKNGILYLDNVVVGLSANAHFIFWDHKLRGKEELVKDCMRWAMVQLSLHKLNVQLPDYAMALRKFAKRVGLKEEGCSRMWSYSNGKLFDMYLFGITREEVLDGNDIRNVRDGADAIRPVSSGVPGEPGELQPVADEPAGQPVH